MRILGWLFLFAIVAFALWPYYHVYRLDDALGKDDMATLDELIDVPAIRRNYKERIEGGLGLAPASGAEAKPGEPMQWLRQNLRRLGDTALEQTITLEWARDNLKQAAARASEAQPPYLIAAVTFAFFESYDRFIVRLGELGVNATHVRMRLEGGVWRVTDIIL